MLRQSLTLHRRGGGRLFDDYLNRQRAKTFDKVPNPFHQNSESRRDAVQEYLRRRNRIGKEHEISSKRAQIEYERLDKQSSRLRFSQFRKNSLLGMQGMTDDMPLSIAARAEVSPSDALLYQDEYEYAMSQEPTNSYSNRMSRRVMEGRQWPSLPQSYELRSVTLNELEHESNMSPSARAFSEKILFHLSRSLKTCPHHIREGIRWEELILSRVIASRRSTRIYIVWSTVAPHARVQMEPLLEKLNAWVVALLKFNIKTIPNLPQITWVYDHGALQTRLPRDLKKQLKSLYGDLHHSNKERVRYLEKVDSLSAKMKDVPWFMPYLWSKEKKMATRRVMGEDMAAVERRKTGAASGTKPGYVS